MAENDSRAVLLHRLQVCDFVLVELNEYLDTHPDDAGARALFSQLAREAEEPCYATTFLTGGPGWGWTDEPWPWECRDNNA